MFAKKAVLIVALVFLATAGSTAFAAGRHYYGNWGHYPQRSYYYVQYYYKPADDYEDYRYHYCIYYPSQPNYVYYYNPYSQQYWGRYDVKAKGYSLLEEKDRKKELKEIPDKAFPKPATMPTIPEAKDGEKMLPPPKVPDASEKAGPPKDLPG